MRTIIVDDDAIARDIYCFYLERIDDVESVQIMVTPEEALEFVRHHPVDLAILDVKMSAMSGIELGYKLRFFNPKLMLIYVAAEENYMMEALKLRIAGYLLKPFNWEDFQYAIQTAKLLSRRHRKPVYARTFGYFDLFVNGKVVMFKSAKAKELLALLVDRQGGTVTSDQIIAVLWEDRPNDDGTQNLCSKIAKTLQKELEEYGIGDILIQKRGVRSINTEKIDCDLYDFLAGSKEEKSRFLGDYMLEYSWAEERIHTLWNKATKKS